MDDSAAASPASAASVTGTRVWDLPTRVVHWLLVAGLGLSWWTAETGRMEWRVPLDKNEGVVKGIVIRHGAGTPLCLPAVED